MSDQYVSVPRQLLERLISATKVARGEGSPTQRDAEAILAAPAEDVRAVREEPYGFMMFPNGDRTREFFTYPPEPSKEPDACGETWSTEPLYRHPQRPVVLPERYDESQYRGTSLLAVRRWNACIDEFESLNR